MKIAKLLRLDFLPHSVNLGLLVLRVWIGLAMFRHGWQKIMGFDTFSEKFLDFMGLGPKASLIMAIFGEAVCSVLLIVGLFSRFAALMGAITMSVAFFIAHKAALSGERPGETAFIFLAAYVALFITGPGRFSLDAKMGGKV